MQMRYASADMTPKILIVEDDPSILRGMELNLQLEGFDTITATDGRLGLEAASQSDIDLIVLDIMLPHLNGYQVCQKLRMAGNDVPIILLSAKAAELDIVMGLDLGADDYVTKPFRVAELLARIKVQLRRRKTPDVMAFSDVEIDLPGRVVRKGGVELEMSSKEFDILAFLVEREGRAITRDTLLTEIWGHGYFGTDRTIDNFITRLRHKVDTPGAPQHIKTVRGIGYRFVGDEGQ